MNTECIQPALEFPGESAPDLGGCGKREVSIAFDPNLAVTQIAEHRLLGVRLFSVSRSPELRVRPRACAERFQRIGVGA